MNIDDCFRKGLLKKIKPSPKSVEESLKLSQQYIKAAIQNFKIKNYSLVLFCVYTSMFHVSRAILFRDGVKERSHICIKIYIESNYEKLGGLMKMLDSYRMGRHAAIYSLDAVDSDEETQQAIDDAIYFNKELVQFLGSKHEDDVK